MSASVSGAPILPIISTLDWEGPADSLVREAGGNFGGVEPHRLPAGAEGIDRYERPGRFREGLRVPSTRADPTAAGVDIGLGDGPIPFGNR
jgi:hypothetical protein